MIATVKLDFVGWDNADWAGAMSDAVDRGLLEVLDPNSCLDQTLTEDLATVIVALLTAGAFDDLPAPTGDGFVELSRSRMR